MIKLQCSDLMWRRAAEVAAAEYGVSVAAVMAGARGFAATSARWTAWRRLVGQRRSYSSIAKASGFDHTSIRHACIVSRAPTRSRRSNVIHTPRRAGDPRIGCGIFSQAEGMA